MRPSKWLGAIHIGEKEPSTSENVCNELENNDDGTAHKTQTVSTK